MAHKRQISTTRSSTFRLGAEILAAMEQLEERDGIPPSEQARRALIAFLTSKGFPPAPVTPGQRAARKAIETRRAEGSLSASARKAWDTRRAKKKGAL